jgi:hypothetical protein
MPLQCGATSAYVRFFAPARGDSILRCRLCGVCGQCGFRVLFLPDYGDFISLVRHILRQQAPRVRFLRLMPFWPDASALYALDRTVFESAVELF